MMDVIFNYKDFNTIIQSNIDDKMKDLINKFLIKIGKNENDKNLYYIYNGNKVNLELTCIKLANELDKIKNENNSKIK